MTLEVKPKEMVMTEEEMIQLARKAAETGKPEDYKVWSDAYDALHPLAQEELELVGGGHSIGGPGQAWTIRDGNDGATDMAHYSDGG